MRGPFELFPNAYPLSANGGDPRFDFRAFVEKHRLVYIDHIDYPIERYGEIGRVRYFTRVYAAESGLAKEAELTLIIYSDASFGVYAKLPGYEDTLYENLAKLGFDQTARKAA